MMDEKLKKFVEQLDKLNNKNIEYGYSKCKLFGESDIMEDSDKVYNKELDIFYVIRRASCHSAPYMVFFNGGPGVGFTDGFVDMLDSDSFFPGVNVVCMDQRGTGCSNKPSNNLMELKYFTAKYISYDTDQLRRKLLGEDGKWYAFGESYGGHVIRKYLELYPQNVLSFISFGYGECSPVNMKVNIQLQLFRVIDSYFEKYPEDLIILEDLRTRLKDSDCIETEKARVCGKYLVDAMAFVFGLFPEDKIHELIMKFNGENIVEIFIKEISFLVKLLLNASAGTLNPVVAYIDLLEGITDELLASKVSGKLQELGYDVEKENFSKSRFARNIVKKEKDIESEGLEKLFVNGSFHPDPIDFNKVIKNIKSFGIKLHVFGSRNDTMTPVDAIEEEERKVKQLDSCEDYEFHYTLGNHREWLHNNIIFNDIIGVSSTVNAKLV